MKLTGQNWSLCTSVYWSAIFEMQRFLVGKSYPVITFSNLGYVGDQKSGKIANVNSKRSPKKCNKVIGDRGL